MKSRTRSKRSRKQRKIVQRTLLIVCALALLGIWMMLVGGKTEDPFELRGQLSHTKDESKPVFPGASGFGAKTAAGSGRHLPHYESKLFFVRSLKDSGPFTLRQCVEARTPRTCLFETSGVIRLESPLEIRYPFITIAGQSAPSPGIMLRGAGLIIRAHDVLVQHVAIRVGDSVEGPDPVSRDGLTILGKSPTYNVVLDHVSISWAVDENISTWYENVHDITFANCLIAEALDASIHPKGRHSEGVFIGEGAKRVTIYRSIFANNMVRNPHIKPGSSVSFVNNLVYNWNDKGKGMLVNLTDSDESENGIELHFIGNVYLAGPKSAIVSPLFANPLGPKTRIYAEDNVFPGGQLANFDNSFFVKKPLLIDDEAPLLPVQDVSEILLATAGSRPVERDAVDQRIVDEIRNNSGTAKDCVEGCPRDAGGWPEYAVNTRVFPVPDEPLSDKDEDGYTQLEELLHRMASALERRKNFAASTAVEAK